MSTKMVRTMMFKVWLKTTILVVFATMQVRGAAAQTTAVSSQLQFDAVSIRANKSGRLSGNLSMPPDGDGLIVRNVPLQRVVEFAFNFRFDDLVYGGPNWARSERYDVIAKVAEADLPAYHKLSVDQQRAMLQVVLRERCGLRAHLESKEIPVYALVVVKGGSRMRELKANDPVPGPTTGPNGEIAHEDAIFTSRGQLRSEGVNLGALAFALSGAHLGRPVIDRTGLKGSYVFTLQWEPDQDSDPSSTSAGVQSGAPSSLESSRLPIFTAIQQQLGLRLDPMKAPMNGLQIDQMERPSDN